MTPERVGRMDDEGLYQPRIHSRHIRQLHSISEETKLPITVLVDRVIDAFVESYRLSQDNEAIHSQHNHRGSAGGAAVCGDGCLGNERDH